MHTGGRSLRPPTRQKKKGKEKVEDTPGNRLIEGGDKKGQSRGMKDPEGKGRLGKNTQGDIGKG